MKKWTGKITLLLLTMILDFLCVAKCFAEFKPNEYSQIDLEKPQLQIKAINPGYKIDGVNNSGEYIELINSSENSLLLTGIILRYENSSGTVLTVYDFPEGTALAGESLLMRFDKNEEIDNADLSYYFGAGGGNGLAAGGGKVEIVYQKDDNEEEHIIDSLCWLTKTEGCYGKFDSSKNKSILVRDFSQEEKTFNFVGLEEYTPEYTDGRKNVIFPGKGGEEEKKEEDQEEKQDEEEEKPEPRCKGMIFSEIFTYYENSKNEQFIEFYNASSDQITLDGCLVRYKNKNYALTGIVRPSEYFTYYPAENFTLTKNPTTSNIIEIIDVDNSIVDSLEYYNGQKRSVSLAMFGYDEDGKEQWLQTYAPTPNEENNYQKYKSCEEGKILNEETGNCVKATSVNSTLAACPEGQYRNPLTNRCKKYETEVTETVKTCAEGYELNPNTNRCRKKVENNGASYELKQETYEEKSSFTAMTAIIIVAVIGVAYVIWQYREEIKVLIKK